MLPAENVLRLEFGGVTRSEGSRTAFYLRYPTITAEDWSLTFEGNTGYGFSYRWRRVRYRFRKYLFVALVLVWNNNTFRLLCVQSFDF